MKDCTIARITLALTALAITAGVVSCAKAPIGYTENNNPQFNVVHIFDADGCHAYRFSDAGYYHYFVKCDGSPVVAATDTHSCGKSCVHREDIDTTQQ